MQFNAIKITPVPTFLFFFCIEEIEKSDERERERQTDRQTDRDRDERVREM